MSATVPNSHPTIKAQALVAAALLAPSFVSAAGSAVTSTSLWVVVLVSSLVSMGLAALTVFLWGKTRRLRQKAHDAKHAAEQREANEKRFRLMVDVMASPLIFVRVMDGQVLYANRKARDMFAMDLADQQTTLTVMSYYAKPEQRDQLLADVRAHGVVLDREILFKRPNGETFWGLLSTALGEWQGETALVTGFVDITERKRFEDALSLANASLNAQLEENKILQDQLRQLSVIDPLTQLNNRRHLEDVLPRELARAERENYPLALIMLDIDHFKSINDTHGHLAGDRVLRQFAAVLHDEIRAGDIACRYGGEEFLLLLPGVDQTTAAVRAEHWRKRLAQTPIQINADLTIEVTVSLGVACYPQHGSGWDDLIHAADHALYAAKEAGRNRVELA